MVKYNCLNPIAAVGLNVLGNGKYEKTDDINEAEVLLVRSASMHDMELPENLLAVARAGAGVNNIPLDKCAEKGIVVFNTPGANANAVKELVIAGILMASRDIYGGITWGLNNTDDENIAKTAEKVKKQFAGNEILGKKLGVIGLGAIGVLVANAAAALGMEVYGCDPYISVENAWKLSRKVTHVNTREEIFKECDYISVHVPLLDDTRKMINDETIAMMKDGVVILNYARDLLVDEEAMEKALKSGKVKRYMTDFTNPNTVRMTNTVATPHLGASTEESEDNCAVMASKEIKEYIENGNIINSVNYPALDAGVCRMPARVCILHKNIPNMLSQFTTKFAALNVNIENLYNKSRGDYAYSVLDVSAKVDEATKTAIEGIEGVLKVRVLQ
ncbi:MAG: phosphoglycerate dehydrogenase [Lachnospiraceae bacterium]|nr:phosphoglycerate dehydrogenase [Lachnospiraceae bacterium]